MIYRFAAFGDSLIIFPLLRELRAKYKNAHITYIGNPAILPLVKNWGLADEVYEEDKSLLDELYSRRGVRSPRWHQLFRQTDLVISLMEDGSDPLKKNLLRAGAKEALVADLPTGFDPTKHKMESFAQSIGLQNVGADRVTAFATEEHGFCLNNAPIAIHPGCSNPSRRWSAPSFAALINRLLSFQQPVLLLAGPLDEKVLQEVRQHLIVPPQPGLLTMLQNAPLLKATQWIKQCKCYLGNDSGMTHMAALIGVPTIGLFLPNWVIPMHPLGPAVELIVEDDLEQLPVERVFDCVRKYV